MADQSAPQTTGGADQTREFGQLSITLPTERANLAKGRFYGGSGRRAEDHMRPALPKIPSEPSVFLLLGGKSLGVGPLRPEEISSAEASPDRAALTKTRPTLARPKQLVRQTKQMGLANSSDAPLTRIDGGGRVHYVNSTTPTKQRQLTE